MARLWNLRTNGGVRRTLRLEQGAISLQFSGDGQRLLTCAVDGGAGIWDAHSGRLLGALPRLRQGVSQVGFSPDGQLVVAACADGNVDLYNSETGEPLASTSTTSGPEIPYIEAARDAQISPDGVYIVSVSEDRTAVIRDAATGACVMQTPPQSGYVTHAEFSPDSRFLLTLIGAGSDSPAARVWECATGEPVTPLLKHTASFSVGAWNPNGREVALAACDGAVLLCDVSPAEGSVEALRREAEVLSAHRIVPGHGLVSLTAEETRGRWTALKAAPPR